MSKVSINPFYRIYCRGYQLALRAALPVLPYREPAILHSNSGVTKTLRENQKTRPLLVTDPTIRRLGLTKTLEKTLKAAKLAPVIYDQVVANPTSKNVAEAVKLYQKQGCDSIIAFGGGSSMDCAKAAGAQIANPDKKLSDMAGILKVRHKIPLLIAVPTTAGTGSETTLAAVIVDAKTRHKYAINDFPLIPDFALLDPKLTENLPPLVTAATGMDALTHAIEAYIGRSTTRKTRAAALEATKLIFANLEKAYKDGHNLEARRKMLKAAYLAGTAFTESYVGYVHAIAHSLGGKYDLPHGLANAVILPYVLDQYGEKIHRKLWRLGVYAGLFPESTPVTIGAGMFIRKIRELDRKLGLGEKLPAIRPQDIPKLAKIAVREANPLYPVPILWSAEQLEEIYVEISDD